MRRIFNVDFQNRSLRGKIIAIVIIALLSLGLSWVISRVAFGKIVTTVEDVTKPNDKLRVLKDLSQYISLVGQDQRKQILQNPDKIIRVELKESKQIKVMLDTLRLLCAENDKQTKLVDSVEIVIADYDKLVTDYLKTYAAFFDNKLLSGKFRSLSEMVAANVVNVDSNVITTEKKQTITTIVPNEVVAEKQLSFFQRVFGSKKPQPKKPDPLTPREIIKNEVNVRIDTLVVSQRDSMIRQIEQSIQTIDKYNQAKNLRMAKSELKLIRGVNEYFDILQRLLRTLEEEELASITAGNSYLRATVKNGMIRISVIMVLFIVIAFILAYLIFSDISQSNMYRKQLLEAKEEAEFLGTVKHRFLSNMSHEIRTPLQSIIGFAEQMMTEKQPSHEAVEAINQSADHLLHIVNEVLDYTRITSGKFTLETHVFDINDVLREITGIMKQPTGPKNIEFVYNTPDSVHPYYSGDSFRLKQVLYNLIGNAIKFTDKGKIELKIEADEKEEETHFRFIVNDTGVGISQTNLGLIFNEFEQGESITNANRSGTGLGLSIVKTLVELQYGSITVSSEVGVGSTFTVELTYQKALETEISTHNLTYKLNVPEKTTGKVLLIDDDPFIIKLCSTIFNKHGVMYRCETSALHVLESTWDEEISIVFMDIEMPHISGIELCKLLRKSVSGQIKIIALTAHALPQEQQSILEQGFDGLIVKPFKEKDVLSWLNLPAVGTVDQKQENHFDLTNLRSFCMDDNDLMRKTLIVFIEETTKDLAGIKSLSEAKEYEALREIVHKLAGRIGQIGDMDLSIAYRKLERKFAENTVESKDIQWLEKLSCDTEDFIKRIDQEVEMIKSEIIP